MFPRVCSVLLEITHGLGLFLPFSLSASLSFIHDTVDSCRTDRNMELL